MINYKYWLGFLVSVIATYMIGYSIGSYDCFIKNKVKELQDDNHNKQKIIAFERASNEATNKKVKELIEKNAYKDSQYNKVKMELNNAKERINRTNVITPEFVRFIQRSEEPSISMPDASGVTRGVIKSSIQVPADRILYYCSELRIHDDKLVDKYNTLLNIYNSFKDHQKVFANDN